jgi:phage terminase Nu1 subunit (DNA packaging protein)
MSESMDETSTVFDRQVDADELAAWLGVSAVAVRDHVRAGVLERSGKRFALRPNIQKYAAHLRRLVVTRSEGPAAVERARLTRAQAALASLKARKLSGALIDAEQVRNTWLSVMASVRARLLAIPGRVQQTAPHLSADDIAAIDREIRAALSELADGAEANEVANPPS